MAMLSHGYNPGGPAGAPLVRIASTPSNCDMETRESRRWMLEGSPLTQRSDEDTHKMVDALDRYVLGIAELLPQLYGDGPEVGQAKYEVQTVARMDSRLECVSITRAVLLFALGKEESVARHWQGHPDEAMARDLAERVVPLISPRYVKNCAQNPVAFVRMTMALHHLWAGETLGNFKAPHRDRAVGKLCQRRNRES